MNSDASIGTGESGSKIIILGEHAVVYGSKAIAVGLPNRFTVTATPCSGPTTLWVPNWDFIATVGKDKKEDIALAKLVQALGLEGKSAKLACTTNTPAGAGLGASASISAASARALCRLFHLTEEPHTLFAAIQAAERVFHGNPSGLDAAAVLQAGLLLYQKDTGVSQLQAVIPNLLVVHSGATGSTEKTVKIFASALDSKTLEANARLHKLMDLVEQGQEAIAKQNNRALGVIMNEAQAHLAWFGVSTPALDKICQLANANGAHGAKLTGGGGGGCAVILVDEDKKQNLISCLQRNGFQMVI